MNLVPPPPMAAPELTPCGFRRALETLHDDLMAIEDDDAAASRAVADVTADTACKVWQRLERKVQARMHEILMGTDIAVPQRTSHAPVARAAPGGAAPQLQSQPQQRYSRPVPTPRK